MLRGYDISEQQKKMLNRMNLKTINSATFVNLNNKTIKNIKKVENYITYG